MNKARTLAIIVVSLFLTGTLAVIPIAGEDGSSRVLDDTFSFDDAGTDSTMTMDIAKGSVVTAATMSIKGVAKGVPEVDKTYDYLNRGSSVAYEGSTADDPVSKTPANYMKTLFDQKSYSVVATSDDIYKDTVLSSGSIIQESAYQHFSFKITADPPSKIEPLWEGQGNIMTNQGRLQYGAKVHIYDFTNTNWVKVGEYSGLFVDQTISKLFDTDAENYVDSNDTVHMIAQTDAGIMATLQTDYVSLNVTTGGWQPPTDPSLDVGDDGDTEWDFTGEYTGTESVDFKTELQEHIDAGGHGPGDVTVKFTFSSASAGILEVHDLTVEYDEPMAPVWSAITMVPLSEDDVGGEGDNLLDLLDFVSDDKVLDDLVFEITYEEDTTLVDATLDPDGHHVDFTVAADWWGSVGFKAKATDIDTLEAETSEFTVTVSSVNDPPDIDVIGAKSGKAGTQFDATITASDVDMELDDTETLTFSDNTDMFNIDPVTGVIGFVPMKDDVGQHTVTITVTDKAGKTDHTIMGLVINSFDGTVNNPPVLDPIGDLTAYEETQFELEVTATDADSIYGDRLTFSDDSDLFDINKDHGKVSFIPTQEEVGTYQVTFTVRDIAGVEDSVTVELTIENINDPPVISSIASTTLNEGDLLDTTVTAEDIDLQYDPNETLTFSDDSTKFDIDPASGQILFQSTGGDAGDYTVTITVTDNSGETDSAVLTLKIIDINLPPVVGDPLPEDNNTVKEGTVIKANASDPDGDDLTYEWKDEKGNVISEDPELDTKKLGPGEHKVTLSVSDGEKTTDHTFDVDVEKDPKLHKKDNKGSIIPGFEAVFLLAAMFIVVSFMLRKKRS